MVKLGNNFAEKGAKQALLEDGFDTIPLMTPLDVNQLQFPPPDKVVVKTKTDYEPDRKKGKGRISKIAEFTVSITDSMSERFKNAQCIPDGLAAYYAEQDAHSPDKFYAIVNHYDLAKQSISRSVSPWMSVLSEEKLSEQETEAAEKAA
ncbi:neuronal vesicle trafficking-associated protein 1 isoform X2 [Pteropus alecto]|uniref:neuronal vesicle trafficking-associated protein 1 isoform X2 n=1 Tax=Pteropus alecto TaxID=9402 RepID=UPI000D53196A|nr:neuronal vesicle trafficking-associated protein 1 isoform X2 [Pteropus alecto]